MTWAKFDDGMVDHRKVRRALREGGLAAFGLHCAGIIHAARYLTDGYLEPEFVEDIFDDARAKPRERTMAIEALTKHGLWIVDGDGWHIHDYLDHNPSRASVEANREWDRRRKELFRDPELVAAIRDRDQGRCRYCARKVNWKDRRGESGGTYDHVQPRGANNLGNVVVACRACNMRKGPRTPSEAGMELLEPGSMSGPARSSPELVPELDRELGTNNSPSRTHSRPVPVNPPSPPEGGRKRDQDDYEDQLRSFAASLLPEADTATALSAVKGALGNVRIRHERPTREQVLDEIRRWQPELVGAVA